MPVSSSLRSRRSGEQIDRASRTRAGIMRIGVAVPLVVLLSALYVYKLSKEMPDFGVYRRAAVRVWSAEPLYQAGDGHYQFKYLPAFALAVAPLGILPQPAAQALWYATTVALLAALLRVSLLVLPERRKPGPVLVAATVVLLGKFYARELNLGQANIPLAFLIVAAVRMMQTGRERAAGWLTAAAAVVKPYSLLFAPYLLSRGRLASAASLTIGLAAALLAPAAVYGFDGNRELLAGWWRTVAETTAPNLLDVNNVSAAAIFARAIGPGTTATVLAVLLSAGLLIVAALVIVWRRGLRAPEGLEVALLLTMVPILSPQGWDYVFLLSTPAVMYLVNYEDRLPRRLRAATIAALLLIGFTIFDVLGRRAYTLVMQWSVVPLGFLIVIAALAALRARRVA